jgi:hypothetical protein
MAALLRMFLLTFLVLGVALMHTLGHEHHDPGEMPMRGAVSLPADHTVAGMGAHVHLDGLIPVSAEITAAVAGLDMNRPFKVSGDAGGSRAPLDPATVCMAVLVMLGMVMGLRLLFRLLSGGAAGGQGGSLIGRPVARGSAWSASLSLSRVVVLRT